jgi:hypothetical protein
MDEEARRKALWDIPDEIRRISEEDTTPATRASAGADEDALDEPGDRNETAPIQMVLTDSLPTPINEFYWRRSLRRNTNAMRYLEAQKPFDWAYDVTALGDDKMPWTNLPTPRHFAQYLVEYHRKTRRAAANDTTLRELVHGEALFKYLTVRNKCILRDASTTKRPATYRDHLLNKRPSVHMPRIPIEYELLFNMTVDQLAKCCAALIRFENERQTHRQATVKTRLQNTLDIIDK